MVAPDRRLAGNCGRGHSGRRQGSGVGHIVDGLVMEGVDRSRVPMVRAMIPGVIGMGRVGVVVMVVVMVGGFSRSMIVMRCMVGMVGMILMRCMVGMIVMRCMGSMIVMRCMIIVTVVSRRRCVAMVIVMLAVVVVVAMIVRCRSGRMGIISRRMGRAMMAGVMRIVRVVRVVRRMRIVGLVFVAHVTPIPQPLCTVFDRETGIT